MLVRRKNVFLGARLGSGGQTDSPLVHVLGSPLVHIASNTSPLVHILGSPLVHFAGKNSPLVHVAGNIPLVHVLGIRLFMSCWRPPSLPSST